MPQNIGTSDYRGRTTRAKRYYYIKIVCDIAVRYEAMSPHKSTECHTSRDLVQSDAV